MASFGEKGSAGTGGKGAEKQHRNEIKNEDRFCTWACGVRNEKASESVRLSLQRLVLSAGVSPDWLFQTVGGSKRRAVPGLHLLS